MNTLLNTLKTLNKHWWKINILILILSILVIAFISPDLGFFTILGLGALNMFYLILSIISAFTSQYKKSLIFSIMNIALVGLAYYLGLLILLNEFF